MHLEGPWLSTTGKKRGPKKWASAEAKHKAEMLNTMWQEKLKTLGADQESKKRSRAMKAPALTVKITTPPGRETPKVVSQDTGWIPCTTTTNQAYTGTKVKGIGTMHKSNAVPIFSDEEAVEISTMRR